MTIEDVVPVIMRVDMAAHPPIKEYLVTQQQELQPFLSSSSIDVETTDIAGVRWIDETTASSLSSSEVLYDSLECKTLLDDLNGEQLQKYIIDTLPHYAEVLTCIVLNKTKCHHTSRWTRAAR